MDARDVIRRPVITERSTEIMDDKKYTFEVDVKANKTQIKQAIEEIFEVKVDKVNTMNYKPKFRRFGRYEGYKPARKKAIVSLTDDSEEIEIFGEA
ncbi:large subunit ribosomal protein L23 [Geomicrobium halophilum]|uniref:Large ribosomal subunit protein uL23 n=1 Tax=Geomicrobium halophilum TaxID=549000 RepID=A0A841Q0T6_9BACL|nr:50S ribosomal protein L23 [Geomicrobium halophilum]MBB6451463.1 large subunit ribosomal protein L23 [Geomicrobium halophilum]